MTEVCIVAAAVVVLAALGVAMALVLRVVRLVTPAFTRCGSSWGGKQTHLKADTIQIGEL